MNENKKITSADKIPGCEKLTRPEEIKGLSKYLGAIRETQEAWIEENMPDEIEETLRIDDNIQELPNGVIGLDLEDKEIGISKKLISVGEIPDINLPKDTKKLNVSEKLDISRKVDKISVSDNIQLPESIEKIKVNTNTQLPDKVDKINTTPVLNLPDGIEKIEVNTNTQLPEKVDKIRTEDDEKLPTGSIKLGVSGVEIKASKVGLKIGNDVSELPESSIALSVPADKLETGMEKLKITGEINKLPVSKKSLNIPAVELKQGKRELRVDDNTELSNFIDTLDDVPYLNDIPKEKKGLSYSDTTTLPGDLIRPETKRSDIPSLPDSILGLDKENSEITELPKFKYESNASIRDIGEKVDPEIESVLKMNAEDEYRWIMKLLNPRTAAEMTGNGNLKLAGLISAYLGGRPLNKETIQAASRDFQNYFSSQKVLIEGAMKGGKKNEKSLEETKSGRGKEVARFIQPGDLEKDKLKERVPDRALYQLPGTDFFNLKTYDPNTYIRLGAERASDWIDKNGKRWAESVGFGIARKAMLDGVLLAETTLRSGIERLTGLSRDRLPGWSGDGFNDTLSTARSAIGAAGNVYNSVMSGSVSNTISSLTNGIKQAIATPKNRAYKDNRNPNGNIINFGLYNGIIAAETVNNKNIIYRSQRIPGSGGWSQYTTEDGKKKFRNYGNTGWRGSDGVHNIPYPDYSSDKRIFITNKEKESSYLNNTGLALTLQDLCGETTNPSNLNDLVKTLKESPYITTPRKIIAGQGGVETNATIDTNAYWEAIIEPFCKKDLNGGWSYLPRVEEINIENEKEHGHNTGYSKWVPISNLELQKSKINSKSLGLFDGEINYPVSVEFTNELRMTIVDDQYKSWKRYFQKCADVSVYNSEAHNENYYGEDYTISRPTAIDKTKMCIAYYKNITFRIRLYFMTPQYSTIKKYDLLCVLKEFSEDYIGDIDPGGVDLNVSFSIVGEDPDRNTIRYVIGYNGEDGNDGWLDSRDITTTTLGADLKSLKSKLKTKPLKKTTTAQDQPQEEPATLKLDEKIIVIPCLYFSDAIGPALDRYSIGVESNKEIAVINTTNKFSSAIFNKTKSKIDIIVNKANNEIDGEWKDTINVTAGNIKEEIKVTQMGLPNVTIEFSEVINGSGERVYNWELFYNGKPAGLPKIQQRPANYFPPNPWEFTCDITDLYEGHRIIAYGDYLKRSSPGRYVAGDIKFKLGNIIITT